MHMLLQLCQGATLVSYYVLWCRLFGIVKKILLDIYESRRLIQVLEWDTRGSALSLLRGQVLWRTLFHVPKYLFVEIILSRLWMLSEAFYNEHIFLLVGIQPTGGILNYILEDISWHLLALWYHWLLNRLLLFLITLFTETFLAERLISLVAS